ncbi:Fatty acid desaturase [Lacunisphaera limnophila]|uniref:Fatty acid desaturase n=1 Tax=Lacunisphaera limnophila TaxID=1838286 RepID=A0A1D8ASN6_9BACT|nr:acyl-CoA desaturase [Lacunisphaera limnophila]AOS43904.1 Fatty acid desaturase [Lacunisphaera limnophila]
MRRFFASLVQWIDSDYSVESPDAIRAQPDGVNLVRCIPFIILHLGCLGVIWVGWSWFAVWTAVALYFLRMFAVTGIFHRYFSHKTYSTSRFGQFLLALWTGTTVQRGPLWWAYHHRHHHQHSDEPEDAHSPHVHGFLWSHIGWITSKRNFPTDYSKVKDLAKFPELVWLNRFDIVVPVLFATGLFGLGRYLEHAAPGLGTSGAQLLVWGFFISTTFLFHGTASINSFTHLWGKRRFNTTDDSRNSFILALVCLGEGWHNNHHRYQSSTRNGFYWWEIDPTYYGLKLLSWTGFIWGLKPVPASIYEEAAQIAHHDTIRRFSTSSVQHEINTLRKVVPTAAAIAIATVNSPEVASQLKKDGPAIHKDVAEQTEHPGTDQQ